MTNQTDKVLDSVFNAENKDLLTMRFHVMGLQSRRDMRLIREGIQELCALNEQGLTTSDCAIRYNVEQGRSAEESVVTYDISFPRIKDEERRTMKVGVITNYVECAVKRTTGYFIENVCQAYHTVPLNPHTFADELLVQRLMDSYLTAEGVMRLLQEEMDKDETGKFRKVSLYLTNDDALFGIRFLRLPDNDARHRRIGHLKTSVETFIAEKIPTLTKDVAIEDRWNRTFTFLIRLTEDPHNTFERELHSIIKETLKYSVRYRTLNVNDNRPLGMGHRSLKKLVGNLTTIEIHKYQEKNYAVKLNFNDVDIVTKRLPLLKANLLAIIKEGLQQRFSRLSRSMPNNSAMIIRGKKDEELVVFLKCNRTYFVSPRLVQMYSRMDFTAEQFGVTTNKEFTPSPRYKNVYTTNIADERLNEEVRNICLML